jgi:hypothetical protein
MLLKRRKKRKVTTDNEERKMITFTHSQQEQQTRMRTVRRMGGERTDEWMAGGRTTRCHITSLENAKLFFKYSV